jgi:chaperonin cofactor prefoldin
MDAEALLKLFTNFGVSGLIGYLLYLMVKERFADLKERVGKLETKVDECERDREELWKRISEVK